MISNENRLQITIKWYFRHSYNEIYRKSYFLISLDPLLLELSVVILIHFEHFSSFQMTLRNEYQYLFNKSSFWFWSHSAPFKLSLYLKLGVVSSFLSCASLVHSRSWLRFSCSLCHYLKVGYLASLQNCCSNSF